MNQTSTSSDAERIHELKTDPAVFEAVARGDKTHEIRLNDRNFQVGDTLLLRETESTGAEMHPDSLRPTKPLVYTGRTATRTVSHIQTGYGLADGWCILSFAPADVAADSNLVKLLQQQVRDLTMLIEVKDRSSARLAALGATASTAERDRSDAIRYRFLMQQNPLPAWVGGDGKKALAFADHIIMGMFEGGDWDGAEVQELAVKYGLLKPEEQAGPCGEECSCASNGAEWPSICYRKTYLAAIAATPEAP